MSLRRFFAIFVLLWLVAASSSFVVAQESARSAEPSTSTEPLGENDRIPFMQSDETPVNEGPNSTNLLIKTLGSMVLIVGLIFAGAWVARKLGYGADKTAGTENEIALSILKSVSLGNARTISAVQFGSRTLLVGSTSQTFTLLAEERSDESLPLSSPRSVAEMLADNEILFEDEFEKAASQLNLLGQVGRNA